MANFITSLKTTFKELQEDVKAGYEDIQQKRPALNDDVIIFDQEGSIYVDTSIADLTPADVPPEGTELGLREEDSEPDWMRGIKPYAERDGDYFVSTPPSQDFTPPGTPPNIKDLAKPSSPSPISRRASPPTTQHETFDLRVRTDYPDYSERQLVDGADDKEAEDLTKKVSVSPIVNPARMQSYSSDSKQDQYQTLRSVNNQEVEGRASTPPQRNTGQTSYSERYGSLASFESPEREAETEVRQSTTSSRPKRNAAEEFRRLYPDLDPLEVVKSGSLWKLHRGRWIQRWVLLYPYCVCYLDKEEGKLLGKMTLCFDDDAYSCNLLRENPGDAIEEDICSDPPYVFGKLINLSFIWDALSALGLAPLEPTGFLFSISSTRNKRQLYLAADSQEEMQDWLLYFRYVCEGEPSRAIARSKQKRERAAPSPPLHVVPPTYAERASSAPHRRQSPEGRYYDSRSPSHKDMSPSSSTRGEKLSSAPYQRQSLTGNVYGDFSPSRETVGRSPSSELSGRASGIVSVTSLLSSGSSGRERDWAEAEPRPGGRAYGTPAGGKCDTAGVPYMEDEARARLGDSPRETSPSNTARAPSLPQQQAQQPFTPYNIDTILSQPHGLIKEGMIWKRGALNKNWKERHFTLYPTYLKYFDRPGGKQKGEVNLSWVDEGSVKVLPPQSLKLGRVPGFFRILELATKERSLFVTAVSNEDLQEWEAALRATCTASRLARERARGSAVAQVEIQPQMLGPSQGWLWKKGAHRQNWKRRYFIVYQNALRYYENQEQAAGQSFLGEVYFENLDENAIEVLPADQMKTGTSGSSEWRFAVNSEERKLVLAAETREEMIGWVNRLKNTIRTNNERIRNAGGLAPAYQGGGAAPAPYQAAAPTQTRARGGSFQDDEPEYYGGPRGTRGDHGYGDGRRSSLSYHPPSRDGDRRFEGIGRMSTPGF